MPETILKTKTKLNKTRNYIWSSLKNGTCKMKYRVRWCRAWQFEEVEPVEDVDSDSMKSCTICTNSSSSILPMSVSFLLYLFSFLFIWLEEKRVWFKLLRGHCCLYICELWRWINNSCAVADYWCPCNDNKVNWEIYYHILFTTLSLLLLLSGSCGYYSSIFGDIEPYY